MSGRNSAALATGTPSDREIVFTRVFDAPRELVWKAWTECEHVERWWGPDGFSTTTEVMDVRPGGMWVHTMHGPDGKNYPNKKVYREVVKPERLVYSHGGGREGEPQVDFATTVTFEEQGSKTKLTMRMLFASAEARGLVVQTYGAVEGGNQTLGRLAEFLPMLVTEQESAAEEFIVTREFDAPRELVWKAWSDPTHLERWWGPKGSSIQVNTLDFRPGGTFHYSMRAPNGMVLWGKFVYREILAPERMTFVNSFSDEAGNVTRHFMNATWPLEALNVLTFSEQRGKTTITLKARPIHANEVERKTFRDGHKYMQEGFKGTLDQLAEYLMSMKRGGKTVLIAEPGKPTTILSRVFDAPRRLVYEAYTNPNHIEKWWGRRRLKTVVDKLEVRPGGQWRFVQHGANGEKFAFSGEFREIVPGERIVSTFEYEATPGHVILNTALFEEYEGKTKVTVSSVYQSVEDREGMLCAGMEIGANEAWEMLDELLTGEGKDGARPDLVLTRELNAPRELVWKAWTDAKHLAQWWGPKGFTNPVCEVDVRPGGAILIHMRAPDGRVYPMKGKFEEIVAPERLVFLSGAMDDAGNLLFEISNTVTFAEVAGKTRVTLRAHVVSATAAAPAYLAGMETGWTQSLERLEAFVAKG